MESGKNKGFTLIELLGILIIISILGLLVFSVIDRNVKSGKQKLRDQQMKNIELAARNYFSDRLMYLPKEGETISVTLDALKLGSYLENVILDPITKKCIPNTTEVRIMNNGGSYIYSTVYDVSKFGTDCALFKSDDNDGEGDVIQNPIITISPEKDSLTAGDILSLQIQSNMSGLDVSKVFINENDMSSNSELSIGTEQSINNYFYHKVTINVGAPISSGESSLQLCVRENAILDSEQVCTKKMPIYFRNINIDDDKPEFVTSTVWSFCDVEKDLNCNKAVAPYFCSTTDNNGIETGSETINNIHNNAVYQYAEIQIKSNKNLNWGISNLPNITLSNNSTKEVGKNHLLRYKALNNGTYNGKFCDTSNNCITGTYEFYYNDCTPVRNNVFNNDYDRKTVVDVLSNYEPSKQIKDARAWSDGEYSDSVYIFKSLDDYDNKFDLEYLRNNSFNDLINAAALNAYHCGNNYLYFYVEDLAGNTSRFMYPISIRTNGECPIKTDSINSLETSSEYYPSCGENKFCLMITNSKRWQNANELCKKANGGSCPNEASYKERLHQQNQSLCNSMDDSVCKYYDEESGMWYDKEWNPLYYPEDIDTYLKDFYSNPGNMTPTTSEMG